MYLYNCKQKHILTHSYMQKIQFLLLCQHGTPLQLYVPQANILYPASCPLNLSGKDRKDESGFFFDD